MSMKLKGKFQQSPNKDFKMRILIFLLLPIFAFAAGGGVPPTTTMEVMGNSDCGQEGQYQCYPYQKEYWDMMGWGCDMGLRTSWDWSKWRNKCVNGVRQSVSHIPWVYDTLKFQRHLLKDAPIYFTPMAIAHNSFQYTKAGFHLIQNQTYSITDLLNMGVRMLSPDVHNYNGNMRLVHCESTQREFCDLRGQYWVAWLEELKIWVDKNPGEFVLVFIENYPENKWRDFTYPIEKIFGSEITFTQTDLNNNSGKLPSLQTLRNRGKKVVFLTGNNSDGFWTINSGGHAWPGWPRAYVKNFNKDNCTQNGQVIFGSAGEQFKRDKFVGIDESDGKLFGLPFSNIFFDSKKESGDVNPESIKAATNCGITQVSMDWVDYEHLAAMIWTWDVGQPRNFGTGLNCVKQKNGRWQTADCGEQRLFACRNRNSLWTWKITGSAGKFNDGNSKCSNEFGSDFIFDFPSRADQNEVIRRLVGGGEVWLKYWNGDTETGIMGEFYIIPQISQKAITETGDTAFQYGWLGPTDLRQTWILNKDSAGFYEIKSRSSGKCLDSFQDGNGGKIGLWSCHGGENQKWKLIVKGNDNLSIQNKRSGRCVDLNGAKTNNYDSLMGWDCYNVIQHYYKFFRK